jgi:hypothetical protein
MAVVVMPESLRYQGQGERRGMRALSMGQNFAFMTTADTRFSFALSCF